jgi:hypothetical protein
MFGDLIRETIYLMPHEKRVGSILEESMAVLQIATHPSGSATLNFYSHDMRKKYNETTHCRDMLRK